MKKIYVNPEMHVSCVTSCLICASIENGGNGDGKPAEVNERGNDEFDGGFWD